MPTQVTEQDLYIGQKTVFQAPSPINSFVASFEDDGETGYFYACDSSSENFILDAMHVYNVKHVIDKGQIYLLSVIWSSDGLKAGLSINRQPHALIDFSAHRGYCRSNFPPPAPEWAKFHPDHSWDMKALELLV